MRAKVAIENDWFSWSAKFVTACDWFTSFTVQNEIRLFSFPVLVLLGQLVADAIGSDL